MPTFTEQDIDNAAQILRDVIALVEGPVWEQHDKEQSLDNRQGSTRHAATERAYRGHLDHCIVVHGLMGISWYIVEPDGTVVFSEHHNRAFADKARAVGFVVR